MLALISALVAALLLQPTESRHYEDPRGRFTFSYPARFGSVSSGTNDGFEDRIAALRFSRFPARFGGEPALTRGFPLIDLQALGGLYDSLTLEIFPAPLRKVIVSQLPRLTPDNFCGALAQAQHLDPDLPVFAALTPQQREAIGRTDAMRNASPRVVDCRRARDIVVFDKERAFGPGSPLQHVYGAVRFLEEPLSTFQLIAGGDAPDRSILTAIEELVASFAPR